MMQRYRKDGVFDKQAGYGQARFESDQLIGADAIAANQMSDQELDDIAGGAAVDVAKNQPRGAIKSAEANDALMRM